MLTCYDCGREHEERGYFSEIERSAFHPDQPGTELVCDECLMSERWTPWLADNWPNWPAPRDLGAVASKQLVAFEGPVWLGKWSDSSSAGPKVYLRLADRDALKHFEKATKRRGKKAGQRYMLVVATDRGDPIPDGPTEAWFAGAQWSHQGGASITLVFEDLEFWRQFATDDQGEGQAFHLTMVELQADDTPVDQSQRDATEKAHRPKGGPKSKHVAQVNASADFQAFVGYRTGMPRERWKLVGADTCDKWVKQVCGIESKTQFDHDPQAWERYEKLIKRPFLTWSQANA